MDGTLLVRIHHLAVADDRPRDAVGIEVTSVETEALIAAYVEEDDVPRTGGVPIRHRVQPLLEDTDLGSALTENDSRGEEQPTRIRRSHQQLPQLALLLPLST